ncbi:MAG TPA: hypothetical protein VNG71_12190 [Pyrinomonadaceae bacterium]|nr:hypothetical protein [Pyrinomonadaceae bacterium]
MAASQPQRAKSRRETIAQWLSMGANVVVMVGIIFAYVQFRHIEHSERVQNAINAVNQVRSSDFLKAYTRLKTASASGKTLDSTAVVDDLNFVMNIYDNVALLYVNDLADRCVIKNGTYAATKEVSAICDLLSYPREYRVNFDRFVAMMNTEVCN